MATKTSVSQCSFLQDISNKYEVNEHWSFRPISPDSAHCPATSLSTRPGTSAPRGPRPFASAPRASAFSTRARAWQSLRYLQRRRAVRGDIRGEPRGETPEAPSENQVLSQPEIHREKRPALDARANDRAHRSVLDLRQGPRIELCTAADAAHGNGGERVLRVDRHGLLVNDRTGIDAAIHVMDRDANFFRLASIQSPEDRVGASVLGGDSGMYVDRSLRREREHLRLQDRCSADCEQFRPVCANELQTRHVVNVADDERRHLA